MLLINLFWTYAPMIMLAFTTKRAHIMTGFTGLTVKWLFLITKTSKSRLIMTHWSPETKGCVAGYHTGQMYTIIGLATSEYSHQTSTALQQKATCGAYSFFLPGQKVWHCPHNQSITSSGHPLHSLWSWRMTCCSAAKPFSPRGEKDST